MRKTLVNQCGQFVIETVLIMTITVSLFIFATNQIRKRNMLERMVGAPWSILAGMIECGVWEPVDKARKLHPNQLQRSISWDGKPL